MLIKNKGKEKWLSDPNQLDDKRPNHPAREFGHEPFVQGSFNLLTEVESDESTLLRLVSKLHAVGSCAASTIGQRTVKAEMVSYDVPRYCWVIREKGKVIEEGILA